MTNNSLFTKATYPQILPWFIIGPQGRHIQWDNCLHLHRKESRVVNVMWNDVHLSAQMHNAGLLYSCEALSDTQKTVHAQDSQLHIPVLRLWGYSSMTICCQFHFTSSSNSPAAKKSGQETQTNHHSETYQWWDSGNDWQNNDLVGQWDGEIKIRHPNGSNFGTQ